MADFLSIDVVNEALLHAIPVDDVDAGAMRAPYDALTPDDFELLLYALFKHAQSQASMYDRVSLMITGADRGRDVWLTKAEQPAGLVQCKRAAGISAPQAVREVIKFLLFAELDARLKPNMEFAYHLAVSQDPARTTVDFFDAPVSWFAAHETEIESYVSTVIDSYASFSGMDAKVLAPTILASLKQLEYHLVRPVDLDGSLHQAPLIRSRFFRTRLVVDFVDIQDVLAGLIGRVNGTAQRAEPAAVDVTADLSRASQLLARWPQNIWDQHIERPEMDELSIRIDRHPAAATLLVGSAGMGKSALLAELYAALTSQSRAVFAIKADTLDAEIATTNDLAKHLGIAAPLEKHLIALATQAPLVVLIDQLDAVSEVMDQSSQRMQVLLLLARKIRAFRGPDDKPLPVHIVVSSRPFEARFDARFQQLNAKEIVLSLPSHDQVERLLNGVGIDPAEVPATLLETLRTPFALGLYVDLVKLGASANELTPGNLLDSWLDRKLPAGPGRTAFLTFLRRLAGDMTERETLWRPAALYEPEFSQVVRTAEAVGLIRRDGDAIGFAHQSWLDDFQAKRFATGALLAEFAWSRQDGLFARGTVLRGLEHLRAVDRQSYEEALRLLLLDGRTRRHLRHLATDFIAGATNPSPKDVAWVEWMIRNDQPLANRAAGKIAQSWPLWRDRMKPLLPLLMQSDAQQWNANRLLVREAVEAPEAAMDLIDRFWSDASKDEQVYRVIEQTPLLLARAIARLSQIFTRMPLSDWAISHLVTTFSTAGAVQEAIAVAAAWTELQESNRHHSLQLHDLEKVASQAPLFIRTNLHALVPACR